ncbi:glycosyltransferase family 2 protein [Clostridium baratii]|uniref:glycosyltransferase family 2 protein n=1 Tax=Clostridium baratii TaxID=1561 RepID=UPI002A74B7F5|nr:glycosyltransferase family 2 protein [Clostridium baratii]MDY3208192.1 glycosyltransferase family 2 protein [Clostridium baratii]
MITISLCMIVKDEEKTLGRCLGSVSDIVDEIIIVDTGSKDNTKEIAKSFGAKIYDLAWEDNFAKARNYSFSKATKEYQMWLDGDDYIDDLNCQKLKKLKSELDNTVDSIMMSYSLIRNENGETTYSTRRNRIVKREKGFRWIGKVHEYLSVFGNIYQSDIAINHNKQKESTNRNLMIFKNMEEKNEEFSTRDLFYYANELYDNNLFEEAVVKYKEFLKQDLTWAEDFKRGTINLSRALKYSNASVDERIDVIFQSMKKYTPNGETLCELSNCFMEKSMFDEAIIFLKSALDMDIDELNSGFNNRLYNTWIPAIQLCVCYSNLGNFEKAYYYNELANIYLAPKDKVEFNREYLKGKMKENNIKLDKIRQILVWEK